MRLLPLFNAFPNYQFYSQGLERGHAREYFSSLHEARQAKIASGEVCTLLTYLDLQQVIDEVNDRLQEVNDSEF